MIYIFKPFSIADDENDIGTADVESIFDFFLDAATIHLQYNH